MDNKEIAAFLSAIAIYKELLGENKFKVLAFQNAARILEEYPENITRLAEAHSLDGIKGIKGIGKTIAEAIEEIVNEGKSTVLEDLKKEIPSGIPELLEIQGMGPKKVIAVWKELGVTNIGELESACRENRLSVLSGFGEKSQQKILNAIEFRKTAHGNFLITEALAIAYEITNVLNKSRLFDTVTLAGSLRRGKKIVKDADILVVPKQSSNMEAIRNVLISLADKNNDQEEIIGAGPTKISIRVRGLQVDFRILEKDSYPAGLQYFTGSKAHNTTLRGKAKNLGYKLNEYGLYKDEIAVGIRSEEDIYKQLGCAFIPPEIREDQGEIEAAEKGMLPKLVEPKDIRGIIHLHSVFSDGVMTLGALAHACIDKGYEYIGITDHSQSARYAGGLVIEKLEAQVKEISKLNKELSPFRIFFGIESDIRIDGSLDYEDDILSRFDFIIGSIHTKLTMDKREATDRLITAISNPRLTVLGHISGRLLLSREGYPYDEDEVLESLLKHGIVLEHNCNPNRLDPDWEILRKASGMGILVSLGPDAHDINGIDDISLGITFARKAWIASAGILNCKTKEEINEFFQQRKKR